VSKASKPLGEVNGLLDSGKGVSKAVRCLTIERFVKDMEEEAEILGCFGQDPDQWLEKGRAGKAARQRLGLVVSLIFPVVFCSPDKIFCSLWNHTFRAAESAVERLPIFMQT